MYEDRARKSRRGEDYLDSLRVVKLGAFISLLDTAFSVVLNEEVYEDRTDHSDTDTAKYLKAALIFLGVVQYVVQTQYRYAAVTATRIPSTSTGMQWCTIDLFRCVLLQIPPGVDFVIWSDTLGASVPYHINVATFVFAMVRWPYITRFFQMSTRYHKFPKVQALARIADYAPASKSGLFVYKEYMHQYPIPVLCTLLGVSFSVLAYLFYLAERSILLINQPHTFIFKVSCIRNSPDHYLNCLWFVWVTGFTIGFGDITPRTMVGRAIAVIIMLAGLSFTALIVAMVTHMTAHNRVEQGLISLMDEEQGISP